MVAKVWYTLGSVPTVRKRNESEWAVTIERSNVIQVKLILRKKKTVEQRRMKPRCTERCRLKCAKKLTNDQRQEIHQKF